MATPEHLKNLNAEYFEAVLAHIPADERQTALLYFGDTGNGVRPNYQIQTSAGTMTYLGSNHLKKGSPPTRYNPENLLGPYTVDAVGKRWFDVVAHGPSVDEEDFVDVFTELSASLNHGVVAMLAAQAHAPELGATLDGLAHSIDATAEPLSLNKLESAYVTFANDVAKYLELKAPGMTVLATWKAKAGWNLKREALSALRRTILDGLDDWPDNKSAAGTNVLALRAKRRGQGLYRLNMRKLWNNQCSVTGCAVKEVLVASHAKAWKDSNESEKVNEFNGLLLTGTLEKLFDAGLISFAEDGRLLRSSKLCRKDRETLGLTGDMRLRPNPKLKGRHLPYLKARRRQHGFC